MATKTKIIGSIIRPQSPTRQSLYFAKDKLDVENIFIESEINNNCFLTCPFGEIETICALSAGITIHFSQSKETVSNSNFPYFWCNFCPFRTENKLEIVQHTSMHRFYCRSCTFQSFSRARIVQHNLLIHRDNHQLPNNLKYCMYSRDPDLVSDDGSQENDATKSTAIYTEIPVKDCTKIVENEQTVSIEMSDVSKRDRNGGINYKKYNGNLVGNTKIKEESDCIEVLAKMEEWESAGKSVMLNGISNSESRKGQTNNGPPKGKTIQGKVSEMFSPLSQPHIADNHNSWTLQPSQARDSLYHTQCSAVPLLRGLLSSQPVGMTNTCVLPKNASNTDYNAQKSENQKAYMDCSKTTCNLAVSQAGHPETRYSIKSDMTGKSLKHCENEANGCDAVYHNAGHVPVSVPYEVDEGYMETSIKSADNGFSPDSSDNASYIVHWLPDESGSKHPACSSNNCPKETDPRSYLEPRWMDVNFVSLNNNTSPCSNKEDSDALARDNSYSHVDIPTSRNLKICESLLSRPIIGDFYSDQQGRTSISNTGKSKNGVAYMKMEGTGASVGYTGSPGWFSKQKEGIHEDHTNGKNLKEKSAMKTGSIRIQNCANTNKNGKYVGAEVSESLSGHGRYYDKQIYGLSDVAEFPYPSEGNQSRTKMVKQAVKNNCLCSAQCIEEPPANNRTSEAFDGNGLGYPDCIMIKEEQRSNDSEYDPPNQLSHTTGDEPHHSPGYSLGSGATNIASTGGDYNCQLYGLTSIFTDPEKTKVCPVTQSAEKLTEGQDVAPNSLPICWNCGFCNFQADDRESLTEHFKTVHRQKTSCGLSNNSAKSLTENRECESQKGYKQKNYSRSTDERETGHSVTEMDDFGADVDKKKTSSKHGRQENTKYKEYSKKPRVQPAYRATYQCRCCDFSHSFVSVLKTHNQQHHLPTILAIMNTGGGASELLFYCPGEDCAFITKDQGLYLQHIKVCQNSLFETSKDTVHNRFQASAMMTIQYLLTNCPGLSKLTYVCLSCQFQTNSLRLIAVHSSHHFSSRKTALKVSKCRKNVVLICLCCNSELKVGNAQKHHCPSSTEQFPKTRFSENVGNDNESENAVYPKLPKTKRPVPCLTSDTAHKQCKLTLRDLVVSSSEYKNVSRKDSIVFSKNSVTNTSVTSSTHQMVHAGTEYQDKMSSQVEQESNYFKEANENRTESVGSHADAGSKGAVSTCVNPGKEQNLPIFENSAVNKLSWFSKRNMQDSEFHALDMIRWLNSEGQRMMKLLQP